MNLDLSTLIIYYLGKQNKLSSKCILSFILSSSFNLNPLYPPNAQLTFCDETGATATETSPGSAPIAIVSIANGVVGSAPSKDTSKTSPKAAAEEAENQRTEKTGGRGSEGKSEVTK